MIEMDQYTQYSVCGVNGASPAFLQENVNNQLSSNSSMYQHNGHVSSELFNNTQRKRNLSFQDAYYIENSSDNKRMKPTISSAPMINETSQNRIETLILQLSTNLCDVSQKLERRIDEMENNFERKITEKLSEKISEMIDTKLKQKIDTVRDEVKTDMIAMQDKIQALEKTMKETNTVKTESNNRNKFVIRNLIYDQTEKDNNVVTINKVQGLLKDGLELQDITLKSVHRKETRGQHPGIVIVETNSYDDKSKIMKNKRKLKTVKKYENIYIDNDQSYETRNLQASFRTVLREMGKEKDYKIVGNRLVKKQQ
ncbi:Hypothetical predicted protein [Mytilus galloprovincialis]|uniref:Uncharacterized protein n=1 Tax=Mytilus galloprovincialis TaxID=29158 RepID=A0A8B6HQM1_MYTGA|nr:Hypothetical predicted protein [Mytilus galloprovincialis]